MGSAKGTFVNGRRLTRETELAGGDVIGVGQFRLSLSLGDGGSASPSPAPARPAAAPAPVLARPISAVASQPSRPFMPAPASPASADADGDGGEILSRSIDPEQWEKLSAGSDPGAGQLREHLRAVFLLTDRLHDLTSLDEICDIAAKTIFDVTRAENAAVLLAEGRDQAPRVVCSLSRSGGEVSRGSFDFSQSVVNEAFRQGMIIFTNSPAQDDRFLGASIVMKKINCAMCVPVQSEGRIVGAFYVDRRGWDADRFSETELAIMSTLGRQAGVAIDRARLVGDLQLLFVGSMQTMVKSLEAKDSYTKGHSERVTLYALAMADKLGWPQNRRDILELGGLMHDIGKIGISEQVLHKPGRLNDEEFAIIQSHPRIGAEILGRLPNLSRLAPVGDIIDFVRHHHEKIDGTGYPDHLAGDAIPEEARMLSIADTYDAIATDRPYRKGKRAEALGIMAETLDRQLDGSLFGVFKSLIDGAWTTASIPSPPAIALAKTPPLAGSGNRSASLRPKSGIRLNRLTPRASCRLTAAARRR
jgi:HD-GYP domain-containing protein (c-di-GMP phosphodiesterase class II)